jgi:hypothetical protein
VAPISFLSCTRCQCKIWNDIPNTRDSSRTRFRCIRCGKLVRLTGCFDCGGKDCWTQVKGIEKKSAHRPYYRFQCKICGKLLGVLIDTYETEEN